MAIDKKDIDALASLSDREFLKKMETVLQSTGATEDVKKRLTENLPLIKHALSSLSPEDLETLAGRLDNETLEKIQKTVGE